MSRSCEELVFNISFTSRLPKILSEAGLDPCQGTIAHQSHNLSLVVKSCTISVVILHWREGCSHGVTVPALKLYMQALSNGGHQALRGLAEAVSRLNVRDVEFRDQAGVF